MSAQEALAYAREQLTALAKQVERGDLSALPQLALSAATLAVAEQLADRGELAAAEYPTPPAELPYSDAMVELIARADTNRAFREARVGHLSLVEYEELVRQASLHGWSVSRDDTVGSLLHRMGAFEWARKRLGYDQPTPAPEDDSDRLERLHVMVRANPILAFRDLGDDDAQWLADTYRAATHSNESLTELRPVKPYLDAVTR